MHKLLQAFRLAAPLVCACTDNQDPGGARQLWNEIHELDYHSWQRAPGYDDRRPSNAPHSDAVEIFVNDIVAAAVGSTQPLTSWPVGSLIVKDGWDGDDLELVAVMQKREQGWYWAEYDSEGSAAFSGTPSLCTDCHSAGQDLVRAFPLPSGANRTH